jgi:hypothetical protein
MRRAGAVSVSGAVLLALLCIALSLLVSGPVGAQTENGTLKFEEGTQATGQQAREDDPAGPLSGTEVTARSTDNDRFVERILIPRPDCELVRGETTSFVLEDENGTQADFIEDENIQIRETRDGLLVTSDPDNPGAMEPNNIVPLNERGGDDVLATGGLTVVTSTDIRCEDDAGGGGGGQRG